MDENAEISKPNLKDRVTEKYNKMKERVILNTIEDHIARNSDKYAFAAGVGVTTVTFVVMRKYISPNVIAPIFNNIANPVFNNNNSSLVNLGGHTTKMVKRLSDGKIWETVTEAAAEAGVSIPYMSGHLNGHNHFPDVHGEMYKIIGVGTTG